LKDLIKEINKIDRIDLLQWCYQNNILIPREITSKELRDWNVCKQNSKGLHGLFLMFNTMATQDEIKTHVAFLLDVRPEFVSEAFNFQKNEQRGQFWLGNNQIYTRKDLKNNNGTIYFVNMELVRELLFDKWHTSWRHQNRLDKGTKANKEAFEKAVKASER